MAAKFKILIRFVFQQPAFNVLFFVILFSCQTDDNLNIAEDPNATFQSFSANGQTLPTAISNPNNTVRLEVNQFTNISTLTPTFEVPSGYTVFANGVKQESGVSKVDFTKPVNYQLRNTNNQSTSWIVDVDPLSCKILIDASHDGGVWWFPQSPASGFNQDRPHQGKAFADLLRQNGFIVDELGRDKELKEEMFFGYFMVIRAGGFESYSKRELGVYTNLIERGMKLVFFTDHKQNDPVDELGTHLGLDFQGSANGKVSRFIEHDITNGITNINYIAGSVLVNADKNADIVPLGFLGSDEYADLNFNNKYDSGEPLGAPVMGILKYPKSQIFFIGDMNGLQEQPQPFINNLMKWMGKCFEF